MVAAQEAGVVPCRRRDAIGTPFKSPHTTRKETMGVFYPPSTGGNIIDEQKLQDRIAVSKTPVLRIKFRTFHVVYEPCINNLIRRIIIPSIFCFQNMNFTLIFYVAGQPKGFTNTTLGLLEQSLDFFQISVCISTCGPSIITIIR